jgi:peptidoglycan DL-endopeptidase LytE
MRRTKCAVCFLLSLLVMSTCLYSEYILHYHTVKKGENLSSLARKYNTSANNIKKLNNLRSSIIYPRQKLIVKKIGNKKAPSKENAVWGYENISYTVKKGDTLSGISKKFNVSVSEIKRMNNLRSNVIVLGRTLKIKVPRKLPDIENPEPIMSVTTSKVYYKIKKGDTLEKIAQKYNTSPEELKQTNLLSNEDFKEGQMIVVPSVPVVENTATESEITKEISLRDTIIKKAFSFLNTPYKLGGSGKTSIDCSTLAKLVYRSIGVSLPNTASLQFREGTSVKKSEISDGDLLFFKRRGYVGHVGIYIGNDLFIHASDSQKKVTIASLDNPYFKRNFAGAKRYLPKDESLLARRLGNAVNE